MSKETIIVGKIGGADWVSTNDGGVGQLLFKLQDAKQIKDSYDRLVEENKRLREFCESLQLDVSNEIKLEQLLSEMGGEYE